MSKPKPGSEAQTEQRRRPQKTFLKPKNEDLSPAQHADTTFVSRSGVLAPHAGTSRRREEGGGSGMPGSELPFEAKVLFEARSAEAQAEVLQRMPVTQQQVAIRHIGRVQGNKHVQRVISLQKGSGDSADLGIQTQSSPVGTIQTKLTVGEPDDAYEQEADQVAEQVMRMPAPAPPPPPPDAPSSGEESERSDSFLSLLASPTIPNVASPDLVGREAEEEPEEEVEVSRQAVVATSPPPPNGEEQESAPNPPAVDPELEGGIQRLKGGGRPLPSSERAFFEPRFGADFSSVRVHSDATAAQTAQGLNARAYTMGSDVVFGSGEYAPGTPQGRQLLAHELTHVVQQGGAGQLTRAPEDEEEEVSPALSPQLDEEEVQARLHRQPMTMEEAVKQAKDQVTSSDVDAADVGTVDVPTTPVSFEVPADEAAFGGGGGGGAAAGGGGAPAPAAEEKTKEPSTGEAGGKKEASPTGAEATAPGGNGKAPTGEASAPGGNGSGPAPAPAAQPGGGASTPTTAEPSTPVPTATGPAPGGNGASAPAAEQAAAPGGNGASAVAADQAPAGGDAPATEQAPAPDGTGGPTPAAERTPDGGPSVTEQAPAPGGNGTSAPTAEQTAESGAAPQAAEPAATKTPAPGDNGASPAPGGAKEAAAPAGDTAPKSPEEDPAFQAVVGRGEAAAAQEQTHAPAEGESAAAQAAADPAGSDVEMAAQGNQVGEMEAQPAGQFNAEEFISKLMAEIEKTAPQTLEDAENFKDNNQIDQAKQAISDGVKEEKQESEEKIEEKSEEEPDESGIEPKPVEPLEGADPGERPGPIGAQDAAPKPKGQSEVEAPIQQSSAELDQQMSQANVTEEQLEKSNEPEFQSALDSKNEAQTHAEEAPQQYRADEESTLAQAQGEAEMTAEEKAEAMRQERTALLENVFGIQGETKTEDEAERKEVAEHIASLYQETRDEVQGIFDDLDDWVNTEFENGANTAKQKFEDDVDQGVRDFKIDRYLGRPDGLILWGIDLVKGPPDEINQIYLDARGQYIEDMRAVLTTIAEHVANELNRAKEEIAKGRQKIDEYVAGLDPELQQVGQEAAQQIQGKFDELEQSVYEKQDQLVSDLAQKYNDKLQEIDARIEELKAANKGLIDKAKDAIAGVIETILELKDMLMGMLSRAAGAIDMIIEDPVQFLKNLLEAVKQGLMQFVGNIGTHLQSALIGWLTGALGPAGITLPEKFDLKGILNLVLQVLGLTYENIRAQVVQALGPKGEQLVSALETVWDVFQILRTEGLAGLWEYIKGMIGDLKTMVLDAIKDMVIEQVIKSGIEWLVSMLGGPAGAFVKAVQSIIRVVKWFIENASRIMTLVNSIIDSIVEIASGNLSAAANFVENALSQALPTVIGFLADLLGLGGLADKVQDIIKKVRQPINKAIQWVVKKAKAVALKVGKMLGFGEEEEGGDDNKQNDLDNAVSAVERSMEKPEATPESVKSELPSIQSENKLTSLSLVKVDEDNYRAIGEVGAVQEQTNSKKLGSEDEYVDENGLLREKYRNKIREKFYKSKYREDPEDTILKRAKTDKKDSDRKPLYKCQNKGPAWGPNHKSLLTREEVTFEHTLTVATHWNKYGHLLTQEQRNQWYDSTSHLEVFCKSCNSAQPKDNYTVFKVGPNFRGPGGKR